MAKVRTETAFLEREGKSTIKFKYDVNVDTEGLFSTTLPKDIVDLFEESGVKTSTNRAKNKGYVWAHTLSDLVKSVAELCKEFVSEELISEDIVIRYCVETVCSYCFDTENKIVPNGSYNWTNTHEFSGWKQGTKEDSFNKSGPYGMSVYAKPFIKRVYIYKSGGERENYSNLCYGGTKINDIKESNYYLRFLDDFVNIEPTKTTPIQELPWDENVAKFFVDMLVSMCRMNEKIKDLLTPESIKQLADRDAKLLG